MESEVARANWERMSVTERLAILPVIRRISEPYSDGEHWDGKSDDELAQMSYDEIPNGPKWDLWMAEDGEGFSGEAWDRSYHLQTEGKTG